MRPAAYTLRRLSAKSYNAGTLRPLLRNGISSTKSGTLRVIPVNATPTLVFQKIVATFSLVASPIAASNTAASLRLRVRLLAAAIMP